MSIIRILGLDPSFTHTGYCVAEVNTRTFTIERVIEKGTIITERSKNKTVRRSSDDLARARTIAQRIKGVIDAHNIKIASSEIPSGAQSANAAKAFGIVLGLLASLTISVIEVSPIEVKLATAGTKIADKEDIVRWAVEQTRDDPIEWKAGKAANDWGIMIGDRYVQKTAEHEADAIAGVAAALRSNEFRQLAGMMAALIS